MLLLSPFSKAFSGTIRSYCRLPLKSTKTDLISVNSLILVVPSSEVPFPGFLRPSNGGGTSLPHSRKMIKYAENFLKGVSPTLLGRPLGKVELDYEEGL